ncbi:hypothetical protein SUDANB120_00161 [Streptomyces sp. enrichment culture]|uniref:DUF7691 family protein n=1 Tax=Streptomyces TaxID=1883 RepID=UPI001992243D|nr:MULTISPECIES: hypothetical protein [Streptomyces]GGT02983.1 hypothetical protein GCM10010286_30250 [Streptomyces toxytricini]
MGNLEMSTGDMRNVIRLLTAVERTPEQDRVLGAARERCARADARFEDEGIPLDVPVAQALEELLEGAPSTDSGPGYTYAFQALVAVQFSDTYDLGHWNRPSWFHTVDDEMTRHGVPGDLAPASLLFGGPPLRLPHPGDAVPCMGTFPASRAAEVVEAYEAVLDRLDPEVRETAEVLLGPMRDEAVEWEAAKAAGRTQDTIFFWLH